MTRTKQTAREKARKNRKEKKDEEEQEKKKQKWLNAEEEQVCLSWLNTSQDPKKGTDQKLGQLWDRISQHYEDIRDKDITNPRMRKALEVRWGSIRKNCLLFLGFYEGEVRRAQSGATDKDHRATAKKLFFKKQKEDFEHEHCFNLLEGTPKFQRLAEEEKKKKEKKADDDEINPKMATIGKKKAIALKRKQQEDDGMEALMRKRFKTDAAFSQRFAVAFEESSLLTRKAHEREIMAVEPFDIPEGPRRTYYLLEQEEIVARLEKAKLAEDAQKELERDGQDNTEDEEKEDEDDEEGEYDNDEEEQGSEDEDDSDDEGDSDDGDKDPIEITDDESSANSY